LSSNHSSVSLGGLGLPFVVWIVALALLGCWALIVSALVIHFQKDGRFILLNVVTHVETDISPFQMAL